MQVVDMRNANIVIRVVQTTDDAFIDKLISAMKTSDTLLAKATVVVRENFIYINY